MTLDEAIKHCKEKSNGCSKCAYEHKLLYEWLSELKGLREITIQKDRKTVLNPLSKMLKKQGMNKLNIRLK